MTNINAIESLPELSIDDLVRASGGAGQKTQGELRQLAQQYCPAVAEQYKNAPVITRPMAERCLDAAGYGMFKGRLDQYFPPTKK